MCIRDRSGCGSLSSPDRPPDRAIRQSDARAAARAQSASSTEPRGAASHPVVVAHGLVQSLVQLAALTVSGSADPSGQRNRSGPICSIGFLNASRLRGRSLSSAATQSRSSLLCTLRSVPLGKYWRSRPFVFSLVPRCQGVRVTEEDRHVGGHPDLFPVAHLHPLIRNERGRIPLRISGFHRVLSEHCLLYTS